MQIFVFHTAFEAEPEMVAKVDYSGDSVSKGLAFAYMKTQNIEGSWSKGEVLPNGMQNYDYDERVTLLKPLVEEHGVILGHRSTSVGDKMLVVNGDAPIEVHSVAITGFKRVEDNTLRM